MRKHILFLLILSFPITSLNAGQGYEPVPTKDPNAVALQEVQFKDPEEPQQEQAGGSTSNDDEVTIKTKRNQRRWVGAGLTLCAVVSLTGQGMSIGGSQAMKNQVSPIVAYPYDVAYGPSNSRTLSIPNIEHKPGCTYEEFADTHFFLNFIYTRGSAWCEEKPDPYCYALIEKCGKADSYISKAKITFSGHIISLLATVPFLGYGLKLLIKP